MAAGKYSFVIEQGATFLRDIQYKDATGSAIDLTGYSGRMQLRPEAESSTVYISLSSSLQSDGTGITFSGVHQTHSASEGIIGIIISADSSSQLNFTKASYDLELVSGSFVLRLLEGKVHLDKNVTR